MSCDIHWFVEGRLENGEWALIWPEPYESRSELPELVEPEAVASYPGTLLDSGRLHGDKIAAWMAHPLRPPQNYRVFARLGEKWRNEEKLVPIQPPLGVPEDASLVVRWYATHQHPEDAHEHSYLTMRQLRSVDWATGCGGERLFHTTTMQALEQIMLFRSDPDSLRVVFWFVG